MKDLWQDCRTHSLTDGPEKSKLYGRLWTLCDNLRGGMDASQYKDYVLVLLFLKYIQR